MTRSYRLIAGDCVEEMQRMDAQTIDAIVTDPPYGIGFMGKGWDCSVPGEDFAREALRVLKPGGHLIAFAATRTVHRLAVALEDAGFEIRDQIAWLQWQGFPKSLDVSKAMDRQRDDRAQTLRVTAWIASARDAAKITNRNIDAAFGFAGMAGHWTSSKSQPSVPTLEQIPVLLDLFELTLDQVPVEIRDLIWTLNGRKGQPGAAWFQREVIGQRKGIGGHLFGTFGAKATYGQVVKETLPATEDAKRWSGWGTALKPAFEPAILVRKPLEGTVASNVLKWGTGAINVDGCRYAYGDPAWPGPSDKDAGTWGATQSESIGYGGTKPAQYQTIQHDLGRWPANIYHCPKPSRGERERGCERLQARTGAEAVEREEGTAGLNSPRAGAGRTASDVRNYHPTVKPIDLMVWLCKMITPPGGRVLDPFLGSGTTGIAALRCGFDFTGIERDPDYMTIARARIGSDAPLLNREEFAIAPCEACGAVWCLQCADHWAVCGCARPADLASAYAEDVIDCARVQP